jgi:hypothetical protein
MVSREWLSAVKGYFATLPGHRTGQSGECLRRDMEKYVTVSYLIGGA